MGSDDPKDNTRESEYTVCNASKTARFPERCWFGPDSGQPYPLCSGVVSVILKRIDQPSIRRVALARRHACVHTVGQGLCRFLGRGPHGSTATSEKKNGKEKQQHVHSERSCFLATRPLASSSPGSSSVLSLLLSTLDCVSSSRQLSC